MRWKEINEAPITDFGAYGDLDREGSFRDSDLKAIRNPKWVEKVHNAFSRTEFDFNLYLYNAEDGVMTVNNKVVIPKDFGDIKKFHGLVPMSEITKLIGFTPPKYDQAVTVLLTSNEGDARIALTPWILAHRVAHAILYADRSPVPNQDLSDRINEWTNSIVNFFSAAGRLNGYVYTDSEATFAAMAKMLCKFKSAKDGNLRNSGELRVELATQYLYQGKITFNRPEVSGDPRMPKEEANPILDAARKFHADNRYAGPADFANAMLKPVKKPVTGGWTAFDQDGMPMAAFGAGRSEEEVAAKAAEYEARGLTVKKNRNPTAQINRYNAYQAKYQELFKLYDDWLDDENDILRGPQQSATDVLDEVIDRAEVEINQAMRRILVRCIGKALIL